MAFGATTFVAPEELFAAMLAETDSWRAICAAPDGAFADIAATIEAGGVPAGDAAGRIVVGMFAEDDDRGDYLVRPRVCVRQLEDDLFTRQGGFTLSGTLYVEFQLPAPSSLLGQPGQVILDARKKIYAVAIDLLALPVAAGRLEITSLGMGPVGLNDEDEEPSARRFAIGDFLVHFGGGQ